MVQSAEYPDLPFVAPRAWGSGRDGKGVAYVVVHYTAGAERSTSAEDGAAYDARRTNGVSTHYFHDSDSTVQCVTTNNRANAAFHKGNRLGIQHELCGTVQTREQWLDPASDGTLWRAAKQIARDCRRYNLPVRRLTVAETRAAWYSWPNGPKGIVGHVDVTHAYPEDGGSHTDPGTGFPWDILLERVRASMIGDTVAEDVRGEFRRLGAWLGAGMLNSQMDPASQPWLLEPGTVTLPKLAAIGTTIRDELRVASAVSAQREGDMLALLNTLASGSGGNVEVGAIIAAIDARSQDLTGLIGSLSVKVDMLQVDLDEARALAGAQAKWIKATRNAVKANLSPAELASLPPEPPEPAEPPQP